MPEKETYSFNTDTWITDFREGKKSAFDKFFHSFYVPCIAYSNRIVRDMPAAEDIVQESFVTIWGRRQMFKNVSVLKSYLYTTLKNASLNWLKAAARTAGHVKEYGYQQENLEPVHFEAVVTSETIRHIYATIDQLPTECRKIMIMLFNEGKKIKQVAEELNLSESTVKTQKARGLAFLRRNLPGTAYVTVLTILTVNSN